MINVETRIIHIESCLRNAGVSLKSFCADADVNPATWRRWRDGMVSPTFRSWERVEAQFAHIPATPTEGEAA